MRGKLKESTSLTWLTAGDQVLTDFSTKSKNAGATWTRVDVYARFEDIYFFDAGSGRAAAKEGLFHIAS